QTVSDFRDADIDAYLWGLSAAYNFSGSSDGFKAIANYSAGEIDLPGTADDLDPEHFGIALGYQSGALLVAMNYGPFEEYLTAYSEAQAAILSSLRAGEGIGTLANYDLGGGASLHDALSINSPSGKGSPSGGLDFDDDFVTYSF